MAELTAKGATMSEIKDEGFGLISTLEVPGGVRVLVYEPRHPQP